MSVTQVLFRQWRVCATRLCFVSFMFGGLFLTFLVFPIVRFFPVYKDKKQKIILLMIHWSFKFFIKYLKLLKPMKSFDTGGMYHINKNKPYIFIANHPTLIDIVSIMSCIPYCNCIIKKSLQKHFFMSKIVRNAGYIVNDNVTQLILGCNKSFKSGRSLIIFPEGTRSPAYGLHTFNRGAAQIALRTGVSVVPIVITYNNPTLLKGQPWYEVPEHPLRIKLQFYPPLIPPKAIQEEERFPLKVRALSQYYEDFFRERLHENRSWCPAACSGGNERA